MTSSSVLTSQADDFPRWYQDVLSKAKLAENGPVRGTMVIRPYGWSLWERMQSDMDERIKRAGAQNVYFPLFIPQSYLSREAEHVEGFSPELAVVTHAGGKDLEEPVVVRPTSETVFGEYMARWVQGYRDLPLLLNQWSNVVRWELRPRIFLRTSEFLWQEGHTAHATEADAAAYARLILHQVYEAFMLETLAIPVVVGRKTRKERFAGAVNTLTLEGMMADGKALQLGTSHQLGQNFARAFGIRFTDAEGTQQLAWTTSWGASTRMLGGLIMAHGDDRGLRVPPSLAPTQVVVMVARAGAGVAQAARQLTEELRAAGVRAELDERDLPYGRRAVDWELAGVPVRLELGPRDLADSSATLVRRLLPDHGDVGGRNGRKSTVSLAAAAASVRSALAADQDALLAQARARRDAATVDVHSVEEAIEAAGAGWARIAWGRLGESGEERLAAAGVTVRCLIRSDGGVPDSDTEPDLLAVVARAY